MTFFLLCRRALGPLCLALFLFTLAACSTAERAANTTADAAETAADETMDVAEDVGGFVTDAAGTAWNSVTDLFDDDDDIDAAALVRPTSNGSVQGTVTFEQEDDGVEVDISLRDLSPGEHGFHIHQNASCANDAQAAGGHYDPMNTNDHGAPTENMSDRHVGDFGNITVGSDGTVDAEMTIEGVTVSGPNGIAGHAVIVHSGRDDLETDPAGDAGERVGCGIVTAR